jgi:hypothetical protein
MCTDQQLLLCSLPVRPVRDGCCTGACQCVSAAVYLLLSATVPEHECVTHAVSARLLVFLLKAVDNIRQC